ncbi:MAG: fibronectin type III domain-containing protein [Clostridiales bacterium]|nr:fibronectin type III domain-containing protein [Clostridiales bacterium]
MKKMKTMVVGMLLCLFLFSLHAGAATKVTLDGGVTVKFSKAPAATITAKCEVYTGEVVETVSGGGASASALTELRTTTIYLLTQDTKISFPGCYWQETIYMPGRDIDDTAESDAYYMEGGGAGDLKSAFTVTAETQTPDSNGIYDYIRALNLYDKEDPDISSNLFFVVIPDSVAISSADVSCKLTNTDEGIKITWDKVADADGYYIFRSTGFRKIGDGECIKRINKASTTSYVSTTAENGKKYTYWVQAHGSGEVSDYTRSYIVRLSGTSLTKVTSSSAKKMTVKWTKSSGVSGYIIQYSTKKDMSGGRIKKVSGASKKSKTISGLTKGKTYYVRIQTYKTVNGKNYYSAWSSRKKVTISK